MKVDHTKDFKPPKEYLDIRDEDEITSDNLYKPSGPDGRGWGRFRDMSKEELDLIADTKSELKKAKS